MRRAGRNSPQQSRGRGSGYHDDGSDWALVPRHNPVPKAFKGSKGKGGRTGSAAPGRAHAYHELRAASTPNVFWVAIFNHDGEACHVEHF